MKQIDKDRQAALREILLDVANRRFDGEAYDFLHFVELQEMTFGAAVAQMWDIVLDMQAEIMVLSRAAEGVYPEGSYLDGVAKFAARAHAGVLQYRKYTNEPYMVHPLAVARRVAAVTDDQEVIGASLLHDVMEDARITKHRLRQCYGERVAGMVEEVSHVTTPGERKRSERMVIERAHIAKARPESKTIKLCDVLENGPSIIVHDPGFAQVYMGEVRKLLEVLKDGDPRVYTEAQQFVAEYWDGSRKQVK